MKDKVFKEPIQKQFEFDEAVASVFDDMLERSIPFYSEVLSLVCDIAIKYSQENSQILDLGCSTANTLIAIGKKANFPIKLAGIDNSSAMLDMAIQKSKAYGLNIELKNSDILKVDYGNNSVIIANYMLQFIRPSQREKLVKKIFDGIYDGGIFIFSEKIIFEEKRLNKIMIDLYLDFKKRQGYSDFEISQKREALENVLIPYTEKENKELILNAGFKAFETIFKFGNFAAYIALK